MNWKQMIGSKLATTGIAFLACVSLVAVLKNAEKQPEPDLLVIERSVSEPSSEPKSISAPEAGAPRETNTSVASISSVIPSSVDSKDGASKDSSSTVTATPSARTQTVATPGGCVRVSYRHKALAGHNDRKHCSTHRNFVAFAAGKDLTDVNWRSVCVRVDGTPTAWERARGGISFGPVAGPESVVTAQYCRGKATCHEDCALPKDPFLESIGANLRAQGPAVPSAVAKWDPSDTDDDADAATAIETELREHAPAVHGLSAFKDWTPVNSANGCRTSLARRL